MPSFEQRIQRLEAQTKCNVRPLTDVERAVRLAAMLKPGHPRREMALAMLRLHGVTKETV